MCLAFDDFDEDDVVASSWIVEAKAGRLRTRRQSFLRQLLYNPILPLLGFCQEFPNRQLPQMMMMGKAKQSKSRVTVAEVVVATDDVVGEQKDKIQHVNTSTRCLFKFTISIL